MRRTNANPFFFSRTTAKKWRPFSLSVDLRWRKRHERHQTKARNNAKKNNSHDNNNNTTTTTSRQFLSLILCFCVPFVCSSPKPFVLHQSSTTPSRGILVSRVDLLEEIERTTQNCTTHNASSAFRRTTQTSLSLCVCVCVPSRTTTGSTGVFVGF